jgi:hypothetical protein
MKRVALLLVLAGGLFATTGCETPAYSAHENLQNVSRNYGYDLRQTTDDWNFLWLQDAPSRMTQWGVQ